MKTIQALRREPEKVKTNHCEDLNEKLKQNKDCGFTRSSRERQGIRGHLVRDVIYGLPIAYLQTFTVSLLLNFAVAKFINISTTKATTTARRKKKKK